MRQYALDYGAEDIRANAVNADRIRSGLLDDAMIAARAEARGVTEAAYMGENLDLGGGRVLLEDAGDAEPFEDHGGAPFHPVDILPQRAEGRVLHALFHLEDALRAPERIHRRRRAGHQEPRDAVAEIVQESDIVFGCGHGVASFAGSRNRL